MHFKIDFINPFCPDLKLEPLRLGGRGMEIYNFSGELYAFHNIVYKKCSQ